MIAATHGKRAVDNLALFKPHIKPHEMDNEVTAFEESILFFADAFRTYGPGSKSDTPVSSGAATPALTPGASTPSSLASSHARSRSNSFVASQDIRRPFFIVRLSHMLTKSTLPEIQGVGLEDPVMEKVHDSILGDEHNTIKHELAAWQLEAISLDRAVQILPGVRSMMDSIPVGRYAVATSGTKTYGKPKPITPLIAKFVNTWFKAYGCMTRVGITPPAVTITADDKRLKAGKPAPDPFLLAAECLGFDAKKCVVFEDSPSGIRAGVASGATVIAVCTSHERSKIEDCGAHYIIDNMEKVKCESIGEGSSM